VWLLVTTLAPQRHVGMGALRGSSTSASEHAGSSIVCQSVPGRAGHLPVRRRESAVLRGCETSSLLLCEVALVGCERRRSWPGGSNVPSCSRRWSAGTIWQGANSRSGSTAGYGSIPSLTVPENHKRQLRRLAWGLAADSRCRHMPKGVQGPWASAK